MMSYMQVIFEVIEIRLAPLMHGAYPCNIKGMTIDRNMSSQIATSCESFNLNHLKVMGGPVSFMSKKFKVCNHVLHFGEPDR